MTPVTHNDVAHFVVPGEPRSKARARHVLRQGRVRSYTPARTVTAERNVAYRFRSAYPRWRVDSENAYGLDVTLYVSQRTRRDVDNQLKLVADALNGVVWEDDHQVVETTVRKRLVDASDARTEIRIFQVTPNPMGSRLRRCRRCGEEMSLTPTSQRQYCGECRHRRR